MLLTLQVACQLYSDSAYMPGACTIQAEHANFSKVLHLQKPAKQIFYVADKALCYFSYFDLRDAVIDHLHVHFVVGSLTNEVIGCDETVFTIFSNFQNSTIKNLTITGQFPQQFHFATSFSGSARVYLNASSNVAYKAFEGLVVSQISFLGYAGILDGKNTVLGVADAQENQFVLQCKNSYAHFQAGQRIQSCETKVESGCKLAYYGVCVDACPPNTYQSNVSCLAVVPFGFVLTDGQLEECALFEYMNSCYEKTPTPEALESVYHCQGLDNFDRQEEECATCKKGYALVNGTCIQVTNAACKVQIADQPYCSQKCDDYYFQSGKKCLTSCNGTYENLETRQCGSCASGTFKDETTHECVYLCPEYARDGKCVSECLVGEEKFEANKTCIGCQAQKLVWSDWKCAQTCGAQFNDSFICKPACDSKIYVTTAGTKQCVANCSKYLQPRADGQFECVDFCQYFAGAVPQQICQDTPCQLFATEVVQNGKTAYRCLDQCTQYKQPTAFEFQLCVAQCTAPTPYYTNDSVCVSSCAPQYVDGQKCVDSCSFFTHTGLERVCAEKCTGFYVDNVEQLNRECLDHCPDDYPFGNRGVCKLACDQDIPFSDDYICGATCNDKFVASHSNLQCVTECKSGIFESVENEFYCIATCDKYVNQTVGGFNCVSVCPPEANFVYDGRCLQKCLLGNEFMQKQGEHYVCQNACSRFAQSQANLTCVETCDAFFEHVADQAYCATACKKVSNPTVKFELGLAECLEKCPDSGNIVNDSTICKPKCETLPFQNGLQCENTCGDKFVNNMDGKVCVDSCEHFVSNTSIAGERVCLQQCDALVYVLGDIQYCVDTCGDRFLASDGRNCVEKCGTEFERVFDDGLDKKCLTQCDLFVIVQEERLQCVDKCDLYYYSQVQIPGRVELGNMCVSTCTSDGYLFVQTVNNGKQCVKNCDAPQVKLIQGLETFCLEKCPLEMQFVNASYCNETCLSTFYDQHDNNVLECTDGCSRYSIYVEQFGINKCVLECPVEAPYNSSTKCVKECSNHTFNVNQPLKDGGTNLTCVSSCYYEELFVSALQADAAFLNCSTKCEDGIFKNYTLYDKQIETVCISHDDCEEMLYLHVDADSYLFQTNECRDGCVDPYKYNDSNNCVVACPEGKTLLDNTTCLSECPRYNDNRGMCLTMCPDGGFYERYDVSPFVFRNCTDQCSFVYVEDQRFVDAKHYECVAACNSTFPQIEGKECVAVCENLTYNDSFVCTDKCSHFSVFQNVSHAECRSQCDGYLQNTTNLYNADVVDMRCIQECMTPLFNQSIVVNGEGVQQRYCTELGCLSLSPVFNAKYEQGGYCVAGCGMPDKYNDSFLCVASCSNRPINKYLKGENLTECVTQCPLYVNTTIVAGEDTCVDVCEYVALNKHCVEQCDTLFVQNGNFCVDKCGAEFGFVEERKCKQECRYDQKTGFVNVTTPDNKTCLSSCSEYYETVDEVDYCVYECGGYKLETSKGLQCVVSCPEERPYHLSDRLCVESCTGDASFVQSTGLCVSSCDSPWQLRDEAKLCVLACDAFEINSTRECVAMCSGLNAYMYERKCYSACFDEHKFNNSFVCQDSCNDLYVSSDLILTCSKECPDFAFEEVGNEKYCRSKCDDVYLVVDGHRKCLFECPKEQPFNDTNECVAKCPAERSYYIGTVCYATCEERYQAGEGLFECLETCESGFYEQNEDTQHRKCVSECDLYVPGAENGLNKCFSACPHSHPLKSGRHCVQSCQAPNAYNDSFECKETCWDRFSQQLVCIDECPEHWVERIDADSGASVRFCIAECGAYLYGQKECRDKCKSGEIYNGRYCVPEKSLDGSEESWLDDVGVCRE